MNSGTKGSLRLGAEETAREEMEKAEMESQKVATTHQQGMTRRKEIQQEEEVAAEVEAEVEAEEEAMEVEVEAVAEEEVEAEGAEAIEPTKSPYPTTSAVFFAMAGIT